MALGGRPDDNAKMVWSRGCIAYLVKRLWKGNAISIRSYPASVDGTVLIRTPINPNQDDPALAGPEERSAYLARVYVSCPAKARRGWSPGTGKWRV